MTPLEDSVLSGPRKAVLLLVANIVAGVLTPLLISWLGNASFTLAEGAIITLVTTLALTAGEMLFRVEQIYEMRRGEVQLWALRQGIDDLLSRIRTGLHSLAADPSLRDSFYLDYYGRELALVENRVQHTMVRKEILIDRHHIDSTKVLLSIYDDSRHDTFRATAPLRDIGDEFDVTYSIYFRAWLDLLRSGKVKHLRRIFIYSSPAQFAHENTRKLVAFHNSEVQGLEARVVSQREFLRFKEDFHITEVTDDIGIFSDMYVYIGRTRHGSDISGSFSRDQSLITTYTSFFDALWSSTAAESVTTYVTDSITEVQLFNKSFQLPSIPTTAVPKLQSAGGGPRSAAPDAASAGTGST